MVGKALNYRSNRKLNHPDERRNFGDRVGLPFHTVQKVAKLVRIICKARGLKISQVSAQVGMSTGAWAQFLYNNRLSNRELTLIKAWAKQFRKAE